MTVGALPECALPCYAQRMERSETVVTINGEEQRLNGRKMLAREGSAQDLWLGQQIRALRRAQKLSLAQLAERSDLSIGNLSQIERGVRSPSVRSLQRLSECLKVPIADLFQTRALPPASELGTILRRKARPKSHAPAWKAAAE